MMGYKDLSFSRKSRSNPDQIITFNLIIFFFILHHHH